MKRVSGSHGITGGGLVKKVLATTSVISNTEATMCLEHPAVSTGKLNYRIRKRRLEAAKGDSKCSLGESPSATPPQSKPPCSLRRIGSTSELSTVTIQTEEQPVQRDSAASTWSTKYFSPAEDEVTVRRSSRVRARRTKAVEEAVKATESAGGASCQSRSSSKKLVQTSKQKENGPKRRPRGARQDAINAPDVAKRNGATEAQDYWHNPLSKAAGSADKVVEDIVLETGGITNALALPIVAGKTSLSTPQDIAVALEHLKSVDYLLRAVIEKHEGPQFQKCESAFAALARSIVFQQLATKAAAAIFGRLLDACKGMDNFTPANISVLTPAELRAIGLSERKASYLHHLASNFTSGALSDAAIHEMDDEALMTALTAVKGIGVWSVHMFMMFALHKPDVLPVGDLGVRKGFQQLYQLKSLPTPAEVEDIASRWKPYRTLGSWYMWRVINNVPPLKSSKK